MTKKLYLMKSPDAKKVFEQILHPALKCNNLVEIFYEGADTNVEHRSYFCLFYNNEFIANSIHLELPIYSKDEQLKIAKLMFDDFYQVCDFSDLEDVENHKCPYDCYKTGIDKGNNDLCENCSDYQNGECIGVTCIIPKHMNFFINVEKYCKEEYGSGSSKTLDYKITNIMNALSDLSNFVTTNKEKKEITKKIKNYLKQWFS